MVVDVHLLHMELSFECSSVPAISPSQSFVSPFANSSASSSVCWSHQVQLQRRGEERRVFRPAMAMTRNAFVILFVLAASSMVVSTQGQVPIAPAPSPAYVSTQAPYYISYGALSANQAPCPSGAGQSYYSANCTPQTDVTPYTRSCIQITRCARG